MKGTRIKALIVTMLLLCVALSIGCTDKPLDTPASVFTGVPTEEYTIEFKELNAIENRTWQEEQRWNELKFEMIYPSEETPTPIQYVDNYTNKSWNPPTEEVIITAAVAHNWMG